MKKPKLHKQEKSYSCMVACLRMVLEFYGVTEEEKTLRIKSKTKFYGTHPIHIVECAKFYGFDAYAGSLTLNKLQELTDQNIPVITNILKFDGDDFYIHSVVVYQMEQHTVYVLDPEDGEKHMNKDLFEKLWQQNDYHGIIIRNSE
ncbi:MAG: cysteine peptidase family C39 domain-containing protein [bacterium]|nr:cysteine peptidase family C39 domain-containing protein [bacterium]